MNRKTFLYLCFIAFTIPGFGQLITVEEFTPRRADTIILERNWRTRTNIILSELEFKQGDRVDPETLTLSLKKIWNLQNFVSVAYRWDSLPGGRSALVLTTRDAVTIRPVFGGGMTSSFYTAKVKLGVADHNFLGRNIGFEMRGQISIMEPFFGEVKIRVPRQLLWKNMAVEAGARSEGEFGSHVVINQLYAKITNPWEEDYRYTFSPDIETGFLQHKKRPLSAYDIATGLDPESWTIYSRPFWYIRVYESIGTITHRRHQEEGYLVTGMIGTGIGLSSGTQSYLEGSLMAEYHQLISLRLQFSARWEGHYSSSGYEKLWTRFGPGDIRGTYYGDLTGPLMQLASTGLYYTWINRDFLAVEQSVFLQYASVMGMPGDRTPVRRHYAIGTGFHFTMPIYPAGSVLITFSYNPAPYRNWFYVEL